MVKKNFYRPIRVFVFGSLMIVSACSPSLGKELAVSHIPQPDLSANTESPLRDQTFQIALVEDLRAEPAVGFIGDRSVDPLGTPSAAVSQALIARLREAGARPTQFSAPVILHTTITEWRVHVTPSFPLTEIRARAALRLEVTDQKGGARFRGIYEAEAQMKHPFPDSDEAEKTLGQAMGEALDAALSDQRLIDAVRTPPE